MKLPLLVIQMQRMGDLILSFPLLLDLKRLWPGHPIWVVAEEIFFKPLMDLAPTVTFFPPGHLKNLIHHHFALAINISSAPEASAAMGALCAECKLGPTSDSHGLRLHGFWQLYRFSLTQNNRHNTYHWADLHRLDLAEKTVALRMDKKPRPSAEKRIGLVLGASEAAKHPQLPFWIFLTKALIRQGFLPFFFGGAHEATMGEELSRATGIAHANLCGKLSLTQVAQFFSTLALCITPDTGPMHLADWLGVPVLNLSMGPVRAHETGPYSPGQHVLVPQISCRGCWQCPEKKARCQKKFQAAGLARCIADLLSEPSKTPSCAHLLFAKTGREDNLFRLLLSDPRPVAEIQFDSLYRVLFAAMARDDESLWGEQGARGSNTVSARLAVCKEKAPLLLAHCQRHLEKLTLLSLKSKAKQAGESPFSFRNEPPYLRLLTGFLEMYLQNADFHPQAWQRVCSWLSRLLSLF